MAAVDANADVETLLASIHLEKYADRFRHAGFLSAPDFCHLDNEALSALGVTATGHRKRILRLVSHVEQACKAQRRAPPLDRSQSETTIHAAEPDGQKALQTDSAPSFEAFRNSSVPNLPSLLTPAAAATTQLSSPAGRPVPKPRTVFNRHRKATSSSSVLQDPQDTKRTPLESLGLRVLEGSELGESSVDSVDAPAEPEPEPEPEPKAKPSPCQRQLSTPPSISTPEPSGFLPPVPPRLHRGVPPSTFRGSSSPRMAEHEHQPPHPHPHLPTTPSLSSSPDSLQSFEGSPFSGTPTSPLSSRSSGVEMVSNEIYCGTLPGSPLARWCQAVPRPPPRQERSAHSDNDG